MTPNTLLMIASSTFAHTPAASILDALILITLAIRDIRVFVVVEVAVALKSAHTLTDACRAAVVKEIAALCTPIPPVADLTAIAVEPIGSTLYATALINVVVFTIFDKVASIRNEIVIEPSLLDVENVGIIVIFDGA